MDLKNKTITKTLLIVVVLIAIGLSIFYVLNVNNIAFFDFQCQKICNTCTSNVFDNRICSLIYSERSGCLKDCRLRGIQCGFDPEFKELCNDCIDDCDLEYPLNPESPDNLIERLPCVQDCHKYS